MQIRRQQLEAWKAAQPQQPALFTLKDDRRPDPERTAASLEFRLTDHQI